MGWIMVCGEADANLEQRVASQVQGRIAAGQFAARDVEYVAGLTRPVFSGRADLDDDSLEKLRTLCKMWDVDIRPAAITSHRKFLGPLIVKCKQVFFPLLRVLLKDFIAQQREFNATAITLLAKVSAQRSTQK